MIFDDFVKYLSALTNTGQTRNLGIFKARAERAAMRSQTPQRLQRVMNKEFVRLCPRTHHRRLDYLGRIFETLAESCFYGRGAPKTENIEAFVRIVSLIVMAGTSLKLQPLAAYCDKYDECRTDLISQCHREALMARARKASKAARAARAAARPRKQTAVRSAR